ncbi:hypothetical protein FE257_004316 [Aspergillus nanangensis]|uniref:Peptidase S9 prolyl oligopeptidase catalytic domain-containing protein n=1 Tax=Aspergillus nanangensis TaxID=2582783 RepID=A0AAD4GP67_ASPNN|nr:hypothetical protein FE257_004316 [Aspergillus nanangensis]
MWNTSSMSYDVNSAYNSALAINGTVKWRKIKADISESTSEHAKARFNLSFPEIDWRHLQSVYGWPALQFQAWMRGYLRLEEAAVGNQTVALYVNGILEFSINGKRHFGGDFYGYRNTPTIINLPPGEHVIDIRLIRDVRASGGIGEPSLSPTFEAQIRRELVTVDKRSIMVPELSQGKLGSSWGSINVQNNMADNVEILSIKTSPSDVSLPADSAQAREMLDGAYGICSWMLVPSGVTSWSGDDWHNWGFGDIQAAVDAIPRWAEKVGWQGSHASLNDWIVVGHSNGGQGTWYISTHYPDKVRAAAPVSGYSSIENYVPYNMLQESQAIVAYVLEKSRSSFRHELLLENMAGIPILQQHGSDDDNVPVYHSRLLHELLERTQWPSKYNELPGKNHWFDGVLTTTDLLEFYNENTPLSRPDRVPQIFTMVIPSSGNMASKGGIYVDQLQSPDVNGRIEVIRDLKNNSWSLRTQNIHRFHLTNELYVASLPTCLVLDGKHTFLVDPDQRNTTWYLKDIQGRWTVSREPTWKCLTQRYGRQLGAMDAILRTEGSFKIGICSRGIYPIALQISRNIHQYFASDSQLSNQCDDTIAPVLESIREMGMGNTLSLAIGSDLPPSQHTGYPIQIDQGRVILSRFCSHASRDGQDEQCVSYEYAFEHGMGAAFLRPLENEGLELVVWGADLAGLEQAARLVPTLTGAGQPDFLILGNSCRWKGSAGIYAAGHLDKDWQISPGSYISADRKMGTHERDGFNRWY